jgi:16S rRNA (guanine527-N7)-methyltransferase
VSPGEFAAKLAVRAEVAGLALAPELVEPLHNYYRLLAIWNRKINLTSVNLDELPADAVDRLFIEPVAAARFAPSGSRIIDIGSGGGSPAIPFALAAKGRFLVMVESRTRKSVFLREAGRAVAIPAEVVTARYEEAATRPELQGLFDAVTIRAVRIDTRTLQTLATFASPTGAVLVFQTSEMPKSPGMTAKTHQLTAAAVVQVLTRECDVPRGT